HAKHPEAARRLLEWLASDEAQAAFAGENLEYPANPGVAVAPLVASWGEFRQSPLNVAFAGAHQAAAGKLMERAGYRWVPPAATPPLAAPREARPLWRRRGSGALAALGLLPLGVIFASFPDPQGAVWAHFGEFVLPRLLLNALWLLLGVGLGTALLGV